MKSDGPSSTRRTPGSPLTLGLPVLVLVVLILPWLFVATPWDPDESRYLEIAREMISSGDWIVPTLNQVPYLEKPPLYMWLVAAMFKAFGTSAVVARLVSLLSGAVAVLATSWIAFQLEGRRMALRAGLIVAVTPVFLALSFIITLDMTMTACTTSAVACLIHAIGPRGESRPWRSVALYAAYAFLALAFLTKGPVAMLIVGIAWVFLRPGTGLRSFVPPGLALGVPIFLCIAAPWFVAVTIEYPQFLEFFFVRGHIGRAVGESLTHSINFHGRPVYFYLPTVLAGAYPWILLLPAPWRILKAELRERRAALLCWGWFSVGFVFFSLVSGKLHTYLLPLFPPLSILVALRWDSIASGAFPRRWFLTSMWIGFVTAVAGFVILVAPVLPSRVSEPLAEIGMVIPLLAGCTVLGVWAIGLTLSLRGKCGAAVSTLFLLAVGLSALGPSGKATFDDERSLEARANRIRSVRRPGERVVCINKYFPMISFCLETPVYIVGSRRELTYGSEELGVRPDLFLTREELVELLYEPDRVFMSANEDYVKNDLGEHLGIRLFVLDGKHGYWIVSNQATP